MKVSDIINKTIKELRTLWNCDSNYETKIYTDLMVNQPDIDWGYNTLRMSYIIPAKEHRYTPDWVLTSKDGKKTIIVESKGYFRTPADRNKHLFIREHNPDVDLRFLFQSKNTTISRSSKTTLCEWAKKNGFKYAVGNKIPNEWIKELE